MKSITSPAVAASSWLTLALALGCEFKDKPATTAAGAGKADAPADAASKEVATAAAKDTAAPEAAPDVVANEVADTPEAPKVALVDPAESNPSVDKTPRSIHMTWQRDAGSTLTFTWATSFNDTATYTPRVLIQKAAEVDADGHFTVGTAQIVEGFGTNYKETLLGADLSDEVFVAWTVEVTGLSPTTDYVYRVGTWDSLDEKTGVLTGPELSPAYRVRTGRLKGDRSPMRFVIAGDSRGGTQEMAQNMDVFSKTAAEFWIFTGDMTDGGRQPEWDDWMATMAPVCTARPMMTVQGNHEFLAGLYYTQFALPASPELPEELQEHAWSLDYGNVHIIGLDSNTDSVAEEQVGWLEADLAGAKADPDIDWIFAVFHHPVYSSSKHGSASAVQKHFLPVFEKYNIDLTFAGHDHDYERTHPIRDKQVVDVGVGPIHIVAGAFFSPPYSNGTSWWTAKSFHGDVRNWLVIDVDGKKFQVTAYPGNGGPSVPGTSPLDELTLTK